MIKVGSAELAQKSRKFRACLVLLVLGVVLFIGVSSYFYITFGYGDLEGFLAELRNPPAEEKLEVLRNDAIEQITAVQEEFNALTGLEFYTQTFSDMCAKGEHNWKRSDSFAYLCAYRLTVYYGTDRDYEDLLLELEKTLGDNGWSIERRSPPQPTISDSLNAYTGEVYLVELPDFSKKISGIREPGTVTLSINSFRGYGVPWTKTNNEPSPFGIGLAPGQIFLKDSSSGSPETIANLILSSGQQPIMFAISKEYFRN